MQCFQAWSDAFLSDNDGQVVLVVADSYDTFTLPQALLCQTSDWFKSALTGGFKEGQIKTLRFPDDDGKPGCDKDTMRLFVYWVTRSQLPLPRDLCDSDGTILSNTVSVLIRVWYFGEKHLVPDLQNAVMEIFLTLDRSIHVFSAEHAVLVFERTLACDPLRQLVLLSLAFRYTKDDTTQAQPEETEALSRIPGFSTEWTELTRSKEFKDREESPGDDLVWDQWMVKSNEDA